MNNSTTSPKQLESFTEGRPKLQISYVEIGTQYTDQRQELLAILDRVLASGQYILGEEVERFEERFAKLCGVKYAVSVANGTDSLILAMKALGIGAGDDVITVPNSWISSASSIALLGARPVFVDVLADQLMDPQLLAKAVTPKTKAILPVHLTGKCAQMGSILEFAKTKGIPVIEDAAQSVGAKHFGKTSGSMGLIGSFSLHPLKNLNACGDAGILTTNDSAMAEKLRLLRHHGLKDRNTVVQWGYNSRLDALQAAILNFRLEKLDEITEKRRRNAAFYEKALAGLVECPKEDQGCFDVYHTFVIQTECRDALQSYLKEKGIQTAVHYPTPIHLQPAASYLGYRVGDFPVTEKQAQRILSLPVHQNMTQEGLEYVASQVRAFYRG